MKSLFRLTLGAVLLVTAVLAPWRSLAAQDLKPVAVVSIASVDEITKDIGFLSEAAGVADLGNIARLMIIGSTQGLDASKPGGVYVTMDGGAPRVVGFVPIKNFDAVKEQIEEKIGEIEDAGNGILRVDLDQPVYLKEQGPWVFASDSEASLGNTPADPQGLLSGLDKQYLIAARVFVQNIPKDLRDQAVAQLKEGFDRGFDQSFQGTEEDRELAEKVARNSLTSLVSLIEGADEVTFGWEIDASKKTTFMDFGITAVAGSKLARQMAMIADTRSAFSGFMVPGAAANMLLSSKLAQEDIDQTLLMLKAVRDKAMSEIDGDSGIGNGETKTAVKDVLGTFMTVLEDTIKGGKMDLGMAVLLEAKNVKFAAGGLIADGAKLDEAFRKMVALAQKEEEKFPEVKFDAAKHKGVTFHTMSIPIPEDEEARNVLGETLDVALGLGNNSFYMAFGKDSLDLLKSIIDTSAAAGEKPVSPLHLSIALGPILNFASSVDGDPVVGMMADALKNANGKDHILLTAKPIERGLNYRIEIEDGVLQLIGKAAQMAQGGF